MTGWNLSLFDNQVRFLLLGRGHGDFSLSALGLDQRTEEMVSGLGAKSCIRLRLEHGSCITRDEQTNIQWVKKGLGVLSTLTDGFITERRREAIFFAVADCLTGLLYNPLEHRLCMMHMSLRNLVPQNTGSDCSILEAAVDAMNCPYADILFWFGGGIGSCCYGLNDNPTLLKRIVNDFGGDAVATVEEGPRAGWPSVNLIHIIRNQALALGIHPEPSTQTYTCSSCGDGIGKMDNGSNVFWSRVRGDRERNGAFAMILP